MSDEDKKPEEEAVKDTPKQRTTADAYADFINTQTEYRSIFQSTDDGPTIDDIGVVTGKTSK